MLFIINLSEGFYPALMLILAALSFTFNIHLAKKSNARFKRTEMDKKADKEYVDKELCNLEKRTDIKLQSFREMHEETTSILTHMSEKIDFIYQKHWQS